MTFSPQVLEQLYNHVALPRNVPGQQDRHLHRNEETLLKRLSDATLKLFSHVSPQHRQNIRGLHETLVSCKSLNVGGTIPKSALLRELRSLSADKMLVLHATAQNCAMLIYEVNDESVQRQVAFEAFETSASCDQVLASKNALLWQFPGCAVTVPHDTFSEESFQESFATFMQQASTEVIIRFAATTIKASAPVPEVRDTSNPDLVSGLLMTILEANGAVYAVPLLQKRVRDTVSFDKAYKPWRRSPFYLAVRVAAQRYLYRQLGPEVGRLYYKFIMCLVLSQLLEDVLKRIPPEASFFLRQKLGRRLAKLESDMSNAHGAVTQICTPLFRSLEPSFLTTLSTTGGYLKSMWRNHRQRMERYVPLLRRRAFDSERGLYMRNSRRILLEVLAYKGKRVLPQQYASSELLQQYEQSVASVKPYMNEADQHISVSRYHENIVNPTKLSASCEGPACIELGKTIHQFVQTIQTSPNGYPDQLSRMLLHLMELWVLMDKEAIEAFPLLTEYHPGFDSDILDPIQLLTLEEMERAQQIQAHLTVRCRLGGGRRGLTIFEDPSDDCFAARYYDDSDLSEELLDMRQEIEEHAALACDAKEAEWEEKFQRHRETIDKRNEKECKYDIFPMWDGSSEYRHRRPCEWHALQHAAKSIRIKIFEHPLPSYEPTLKATLFELLCPAAFAAYRDATWLILSTLCHPPAEPLERISLIREYSQLRPYVNDTNCQVALGSDKKAHLECHYSEWGFPVGLPEVTRTCGLKPRYYDIRSKSWTSDRAKGSFWHHFPVDLPSDSPYQVLNPCFSKWPSSNEIQASQAICPTDISVHEFLAWQGLLVGTQSRWFDLLREMGSNNLNFSADSTWVLVQRLVLQIGPAATTDDPYRDIHSAFLDASFCDKLLQQVRPRLESIHRNWREPVQMDILITILLKMISLSPSMSSRDEAVNCLDRARHVLGTWRTELRSIVTEDTKITQFAIWASVLCKRTMHHDSQTLFKAEPLREFIDSSIMLHYYLTADFSSMPPNLRNAVIRDVLFTYENRALLQRAILVNQQTFIAVVDGLWHISKDLDASSDLHHVPDTCWILLTLKSEHEETLHSVHYNYQFGTLLVDGKEMSALPLAYRSHPVYCGIFGSKNPIVFPSPLSGMSFTMSDPFKNGHRIHLGFRNGSDLIIRAVHNGQTLEFIPRGVFGTQISPDLPVPLIKDCYHWLNIYNGQLEIRRQDMWLSRPGNWWIFGIKSGVCEAVRRPGGLQEARLLEPTSGIAREATKIFNHFECSSHIMVFIHRDGKVNIELTRLELSFYINDDGLLYSPRLGAVILQNQDAGTWYGLKSKIVIQSIANRRQKSILVPLGEPRVSREGSHVSLELTTGSGLYLKFGINEVLGRIDCAPEPKLLYVRALLHAYTSHVICDPLTRRTGSEEAIYLLQTGTYMPWRPLVDDHIQTLKLIADLSPVRGYYPKDLKCMETVTWQANFPFSMQDERYRPLVAKILRRSSILSKFSPTQPAQPGLTIPTTDPLLHARAMSRTHLWKVKEDNVYSTRDQRSDTLDRSNVLQMVKLLCKWQNPLGDGPTLTSMLQDAPVIGGYDKFFQKCLLSDLLTVDLRAEWGALAQKAVNCNTQDRYNLMFLFGPIAFSSDANVDLMRVLISFAMIPDLKKLKPPSHPVYLHFRADKPPQTAYLSSIMRGAGKPMLEMGAHKRSRIAECSHMDCVESSCDRLASLIQKQWPNPDISHLESAPIDPTYLDVERALAIIAPEWIRLTHNHELALYLDKVQEILGDFSADVKANQVQEDSVTVVRRKMYPTRLRDRDDPTIAELLRNKICLQMNPSLNTLPVAGTNMSYAALVARPGNIPRPLVNPYGSADKSALGMRPRLANATASKETTEIKKLRSILAGFQNTPSFVQSRYAKELESSINALQLRVNKDQEATRLSHFQVRTEDIRPRKDQALGAAEHIRLTLQTKNLQAKWLQLVDLWPKMTTIDLLSELRSTSNTTFGQGAREALVSLGLAISKWQHILRIQDAQKRYQKQQEVDEWNNQGHTNWDPCVYPDWLLLEIDGDILLREEQIEVALATIAPSSGANSVLQLLMGKGKTSCILPMVAAILANKVDLARIVVPRPLLLQSAQVMQAKLGGLANREIVHIPFSRKTPTNQSLMHLYGKFHFQMRDKNGVILALPEHILSFKLSGLQQLCDYQLDEASTMIKTQNWLDKHARDVLDECDVSLAIRTQLIYPSGSQTTVDGHPMRWQVTQTLLHLVKDFSSAVQDRYRRSIEIVRRGNDGFPLLYFLRKDAEDYLIELLVSVVCKGQTPSILPCAEYPAAIIQDIKAYISNPAIRSPMVSRVTDYFRDKPQLMKTVNLLRGLFVHRILIATLKKRWNVQYGLHPTRAPIAVPYLAKGVPSPAAEWGHPDVAIILTCLSFYYQGLNSSQFKQAFEHLVKTDEPSVEYEKWFSKGVDIPKELEDYAAINVEDTWQLSNLYQFVRTNASLVDFYLNNFVFPKYAKTFKLKLQASGWNLFPSISIHKTACRVTGFSGTNDSRHQLPMLVKQADLPHLAHTNAEVPFYLLAPRNQGYVRMAHINGGVRWTENDLLDNLANPLKRHPQFVRSDENIRILIDAGAQILEYSNKDLAKAWLDRDTDAAAAIYFEDDHRAWAIYRTGKQTPLLASPFADHLDRCVVYLDESHCRGTDLKLPAHAKAALTLGQHLTKDALVQAAMRLRLLGQTQSVAFYSPPEVHQGILDRLQKDESQQLKSEDVLHWVIGQTCDTIEQQDPSYFAQTSQYLQQEQARLTYPDFLLTEQSRAPFLATVRAKESLSLKQLYEPKGSRQVTNVGTSSWDPALQPFATELIHRKKHFQDRGAAVHASALEEVEIEQEREAEIEVETEVEDVREMQRPPQLNALPIPKLHEDIKHFATTGILMAGSNAFRPLFSVLGHTALGLKHAISTSMKSNVWISTQFSRTVEVYQPHDNYVRSCNWVMWCPASEKALIVSPEEANALIPILRQMGSQAAVNQVYLIVYSAPSTRRMLHFNGLDYHATPPLPADFKAPVWLKVELGIFSGRLHLEWDEYYELLRYLGLSRDLSMDLEKQAFAKKPLTFLHEWLALRRKGQDFEHTPMGFVTSGKPLTENHPFFRAFGHGVDDAEIRPQIARLTIGRGEEGQDVGDDEDHDDDEFVPAVEHMDDSEGEDDEARASEDEDCFVDAEDDESDSE